MMKWKKVAEGHHRSGEYGAYKDHCLGGWVLYKEDHNEEVFIERCECLREAKYVANAHAEGKR